MDFAPARRPLFKEIAEAWQPSLELQRLVDWPWEICATGAMPWTDTEALRPLKPEIWDLQTLQIFQINLFDHRKAWFNHDTTPISSKPTELTDCLSGSRCSHRNRRSPRRSWCLYWRCRIEFLSGSPLFRTNSQVPKTLIRWYFDVKCIHIWQNMLKYDLFLSFSSFFAVTFVLSLFKTKR